MKIIIEPENGPAQVWSTEPAENRATLYENRAKDLEKQLAEEKDRADAWELRCEELEQELRDAQAAGAESVKREAKTGLDKLTADYEKEIRELRERRDQMAANLKIFDMRETVYGEQKKLIDNLQNRIHEQDWTIGQYDDENRELRERLRKCGETPIKVSLNEWTDRIHRIAVDHGWWETEDGKCDDGDRPFPEIVALCHSELSEALEEYRNGKPMAYINGYWPKYDTGMTTPKPIKAMQLDEWEDDEKPEGIAVEMLDCIIRILDWLGHEGIDVDTLMEKKVKYNEGREHRHGEKMA